MNFIGNVEGRDVFSDDVDVTVIAQQPRLAAFIPEMRSNLAADLHVEEDQVNIKATTTEGMGFTGRGEGIAVHAVVLLQGRDRSA